MVNELLKRVCFIIGCSVLICSCVKDVDFDQAKDLEINPVIESSLIFFDEPASSFLDSGSEIKIIQDFVTVDLINDAFVIDNLVKAEFIFASKNSINRDVELQLDFLDDFGILVHSFTVQQAASVDGSEVFTEYTETFVDDTLLAFKKTAVIVFTLKLAPGAAITESTKGRIELKSSAAFYFHIAATE